MAVSGPCLRPFHAVETSRLEAEAVRHGHKGVCFTTTVRNAVLEHDAPPERFAKDASFAWLGTSAFVHLARRRVRLADGAGSRGPSFWGAMMYGTYFGAIVLPLILVVKGAFALYTHVMLPMLCGHLKKRWRALMFVFFLVSISVLASAFVSTVKLIYTIQSGQDKKPYDVLDAAWGWYFHGVLIFLLVVVETGTFVSWPLLLRSFSRLRYEFLLETAEMKPEWRLELHERLVKSSRQKLGVPVLNRLVDEVREELKADDTETSHVPLAEKVIQSHGDLTESSSDEWWEGGDARCMIAW
eukprot:s608_g16.t1